MNENLPPAIQSYIEKTSSIIYAAIDEKVILDVTGWFVSNEACIINPYEDGNHNPINYMRTSVLDRYTCMNHGAFYAAYNHVLKNTEYTDMQALYFTLFICQWMSSMTSVMERSARCIPEKTSMLIMEAKQIIHDVVTNIIVNTPGNTFQSHKSMESYFERIFIQIDNTIMSPLVAGTHHKIYLEMGEVSMYERCIENLCKLYHMHPAALMNKNGASIEYDSLADVPSVVHAP